MCSQVLDFTFQALQKAIMEHVCTSLAIVFSPLSPMVSTRISKTGNDARTSHSKLIKWSLDAIRQAQQNNEVDSSLVMTLVNDLCTFHSQCDRLMTYKHGVFSMSLTIALKMSLYAFSTVGSVRTEAILKTH